MNRLLEFLAGLATLAVVATCIVPARANIVEPGQDCHVVDVPPVPPSVLSTFELVCTTPTTMTVPEPSALSLFAVAMVGVAVTGLAVGWRR